MGVGLAVELGSGGDGAMHSSLMSALGRLPAGAPYAVEIPSAKPPDMSTDTASARPMLRCPTSGRRRLRSVAILCVFTLTLLFCSGAWRRML